MTRLVAAEFRKLFTTRLWLWILLVSAAWTVVYTALEVGMSGRRGAAGPSLSTAAGQHALFAIGAGGAGTLVAVMAVAHVAGEYRHRTMAATFLATPDRPRVVAAQAITFLLAGVGYALVSIVIALAVALPWLAANGVHVPVFGNGNFAVLAAIALAAAFFGVAGAGLGSALRNQLVGVAALLLYLYLLEPLVSHIASQGSWTRFLPGVAADGLTQAVQGGVRMLSPWTGGLVFAAWVAAFAVTGAFVATRTDIS